MARRIQRKATAQLPLVARYTGGSHTNKRTPEELAAYQWEPERYIIEVLGWTPWRGGLDTPGQCEVIDAYLLALRQLHERVAYEHGELAEVDLKYWKPGEVIQNRLRIEAGHTVGKTKLASGLVNHFFDCFIPSIVYSYAPGWEAIKDLLWKEIGTDRSGKGLPGKILENCQIKLRTNHFAKGRATNNAGGKGTERVQGQHGKYLMFVLDEAEGVANFVFDAVDSMASGGICIVIMLANPKTRASRFYKIRVRPDVKSFRISCLNHPNCVQGREIVPGAVQRHYPVGMLVEHVEVVEEHSEDDHTFELPWQPGVIYKPDSEYCFRVLGIAPSNVADNTLITVGRLEAAYKRVLAVPDKEEDTEEEDTEPVAGYDTPVGGYDEPVLGPGRYEPLPSKPKPELEIPAGKEVWGYLGNDVAGFGKDYGTLYIRFQNVVWRAAQFWKQDFDDYARRIGQEALKLKAKGCTHLSLRIDAGGGFGQGVISHLKKNEELKRAFPGNRLLVHEVHFGTPPRDDSAYADVVTELYAQAAETLKGVRVEKPPSELEPDLCERTYDWVNRSGVEVKKLEEKSLFKKRHEGRSPDDGDGFVLCAGPEFLFGRRKIRLL